MSGKTQKDKFKELAREAECEDDEEAFDEKLKRIAKSKSPPEKQPGDDKK